LEEYNKYRLQTSEDLYDIYNKLLQEPKEQMITLTSEVASVLKDLEAKGKDAKGVWAWEILKPYNRWLIELYAGEMIERFGGLHVVDARMLPMGIISMFRGS
jgi:hypothetical protein